MSPGLPPSLRPHSPVRAGGHADGGHANVGQTSVRHASVGHASVEYLIALSLVGLVLAIDRFSAFEFLVRAVGEMYARYAFALSLP